MFFRLLIESFARQKRRKALAGAAILLGTTAVTAMLALATSIGDRIHRELAVYGANIVVTPKAANLDVKIAGLDLKPATGGAYLRESDLDKLHGIFWANNITAISPERDLRLLILTEDNDTGAPDSVPGVAYWFNHPFGNLKTGAPALHPSWKLEGRWPEENVENLQAPEDDLPVVVGESVARKERLKIGDEFVVVADDSQKSLAPEARVVGIISTGDQTDNKILLPLSVLSASITNPLFETSGNPLVSRVEISARTRPEDAFARLDPSKLSPKMHDVWYCRPYANSIAFQIMEAIPGAQAEQVRRVEQSEGTVLERISGLMWLVSLAALLAAGFAVSAAMATAVLERRGEIGLMRSLGASRSAIAMLFYAESSLLAAVAGTFGYLGGSVLAFWLGRHIFPGDGATPLLKAALLPLVVAMAVAVAVLGSTPAIRAALRLDPAATLREAE
jgi:putative ABC transport system permease protein